MASETIRFDLLGDASSANRAFRSAADNALLASRAAKDLSDKLGIQSKSARVAADATLTLVKVDGLADEAEALLALSAEDVAKQLRDQGRAAEETAAKTRLAGDAAKGAGSNFGLLASPMGAAIGAGVALSPILVTVGAGLGGLALAAASTVKNTKEMSGILAPLKSEFAQFSDSLQPEVLGVFTAGITVANDVLHELQPVAAATGSALAGVLKEIDAEFRSGTWTQFFQFMAQQAGPDVQLLGKLFTDLLADLPPLLTQLQPLARYLLDIADAGLKAVGALEKMHAVLPLLGAALGFAVAGPVGAAVGALVGLGVQLAAAGDAAKRTGLNVDQLQKPVTRGISTTVNWAAVAQNASLMIARQGNAVDGLTESAKKVQGPTLQQATNTAIMAHSADDAASKVTKLNSAWSAFLALSTDLVTAQLGVEGGLKTLTADAKAAGASFTGTNEASQRLQSDFEQNLVPGLQNVLNGMRKAGAGTRDLATVLATDLKPAVDRGALSNKALEQQIYDMAVQAGYTGPNKVKPLTDWINRNAGSTQNAANKVNEFGAALARLPKNKTVTLTVRVAGSGGEYITSTTGANGRVNVYPVRAAAAGWKVPGSGNSDSVPAMLTPGEAVVPKRLVPAVAPFLAANRVPGFADGGLAGAVSTLGSYAQGYFSQLNAQVLARTLSSVNKNVSSSLAAAFAGGLSTSAAVRAEQLYAARLFPYFGWGAGQLGPLIALWNRESGWNPNARNPTSGAFGIPQALPPSKMGALGSTWAGQILWGEEYIKGRYGSPAGAWAHEAAFGWYDNGGVLKPGLTLALNTTGRAEQVLPAGRGGGGGAPVQVTLNINAPVGSQAQLEAWLVQAFTKVAREGQVTWALRHSASAAR